MKAQFDNILVQSFYLWFENQLLSPSVAAYATGLANTYQNYTAADLPAGYTAYQGAYRQLVAENEVDVPNSGIFIGSSFVSGGAPNVFIDYNNGRVILPTASGTTLTITSTSTVKEINAYLANEGAEKVLMEGDFRQNGDTYPKSSSKTEKFDEKTYFLPACFIVPASSENIEFAFGGEEDTISRIRAMVLAYDNFTIDAVLSHFRDRSRVCVPIIDYEDFPYGVFGSLKTNPYRYEDLAATSTTNAYIEKAAVSRINGRSTADNPQRDLKIGFIDFDLSSYRFPRLS